MKRPRFGPSGGHCCFDGPPFRLLADRSAIELLRGRLTTTCCSGGTGPAEPPTSGSRALAVELDSGVGAAVEPSFGVSDTVELGSTDNVELNTGVDDASELDSVVVDDAVELESVVLGAVELSLVVDDAVEVSKLREVVDVLTAVGGAASPEGATSPQPSCTTVVVSMTVLPDRAPRRAADVLSAGSAVVVAAAAPSPASQPSGVPREVVVPSAGALVRAPSPDSPSALSSDVIGVSRSSPSLPRNFLTKNDVLKC